MELNTTYERGDNTYVVVVGADNEGNEFWRQPPLSGKNNMFDMAIRKNGAEKAMFARDLKGDLFEDTQEGLDLAFQEALYRLGEEIRPLEENALEVAQAEYLKAFAIYTQSKELFGIDHERTQTALSDAQAKYIIWQDLLNG